MAEGQCVSSVGQGHPRGQRARWGGPWAALCLCPVGPPGAGRAQSGLVTSLKARLKALRGPPWVEVNKSCRPPRPPARSAQQSVRLPFKGPVAPHYLGGRATNHCDRPINRPGNFYTRCLLKDDPPSGAHQNKSLQKLSPHPPPPPPRLGARPCHHLTCSRPCGPACAHRGLCHPGPDQGDRVCGPRLRPARAPCFSRMNESFMK